MLLELSALPEIPRSHGVVEAAGPQLGPIGRNIDATRAIGVPLELPHERLIMQVPDADVAIAAAAGALDVNSDLILGVGEAKSQIDKVEASPPTTRVRPSGKSLIDLM